VLAGDGDVGGRIGEFHYIGAILDTSGAAPVVIKSLVLPSTNGKDRRAEQAITNAMARP